MTDEPIIEAMARAMAVASGLDPDHEARDHWFIRIAPDGKETRRKNWQTFWIDAKRQYFANVAMVTEIAKLENSRNSK